MHRSMNPLLIAPCMVMARRAVLAFLLALFTGSPAGAQQWAKKMFQTTTHDFGSVARGAKAEYEFVLKNIYLKDVQIASVRSSCGCTTPRIKKPLLKTYEKGAIVASINSHTFLGRQGATITVTLDKPRYAQVQLQVAVYVHRDVVFQPAGVELGSVDRGTPLEKKISVSCTRRSDWKILNVRSGNPHLSGKVVETGRQGNRVSYELRVHLDENAPTGYIRDHLILVTNDERSAKIPVLVEGRVLPEVVVSPVSLFLGVVRPGEKVTKRLVVRGKKPFRITSVTADCDCFEFGVPAGEAAKPLHLVPVTFTAGDKPGKVVKTIRVKTDLGGAEAQLSAYAVVAPQ